MSIEFAWPWVFAALPLPLLVARRGRVPGDELPLLAFSLWPLVFYPLIQLEPRLLFPTLIGAGIFGLESYEAILYGMDFLREECDAWFGKDRPAPRVPGFIVDRLKQAPGALPPHAPPPPKSIIRLLTGS